MAISLEEVVMESFGEAFLPANKNNLVRTQRLTLIASSDSEAIISSHLITHEALSPENLDVLKTQTTW